MKEQSLLIPGPVGQLEALYSEADNPVFLAGKSPIFGIVCHPHPLFQGTMNNKVVTFICRAFETLGLNTIRFNFRGVSKSEGEFGHGEGEGDDLLAVVDYVRNKHSEAKIWLGGFSFGAYVAAKMANEIAPSALLTVAPPVTREEFKDLNTPNALPRCPWAIIHGEQDELFPIEKVEAWYSFVLSHVAKKDTTFIKIPEATHFFHGRLIELKKAIIDAMQSFLT